MGKLQAVQLMRDMAPGRYGDGEGLYLQVGPSGSKAWLFRYKVDGQERQMGLGKFPDVSLKDARVLAAECRRQRGHGTDPLGAREAERLLARLEAARRVTFEECAKSYIEANEAGWRNAKHAQQWHNTLATYVFPMLGKLSVGEIDTPLVLKVLQPIWSKKPETASRVRQRIEAVLSFAKANKCRDGENPAQWRGNLEYALPAMSKVKVVDHHSALPYAELPQFMVRIRQREAIAARALEFAILTAARTGEVIGAGWSEVDLAAGVWTVPAERMKAGNEHRVPLSTAAKGLLEGLPNRAGLVFGGLSNMAMLQLLKRMGRGDLTVHGFRSTFRDWAAECTSFSGEVAEAALAHTIANRVEAAYRRGDLFEKRRELMGVWAEYCEGHIGTVLRLPVQSRTANAGW